MEKEEGLRWSVFTPHDGGMASDRALIQALKNIISEVDLIPETTPDLPQNRTGRSR